MNSENNPRFSIAEEPIGRRFCILAVRRIPSAPPSQRQAMRTSEDAMAPSISHKMARRRFWGYLGSGGGFRRVQRSVNGRLMGFLCVMSRAGDAVLGEGAAYG